MFIIRSLKTVYSITCTTFLVCHLLIKAMEQIQNGIQFITDKKDNPSQTVDINIGAPPSLADYFKHWVKVRDHCTVDR